MKRLVLLLVAVFGVGVILACGGMTPQPVGAGGNQGFMDQVGGSGDTDWAPSLSDVVSNFTDSATSDQDGDGICDFCGGSLDANAPANERCTCDKVLKEKLGDFENLLRQLERDNVSSRRTMNFDGSVEGKVQTIPTVL